MWRLGILILSADIMAEGKKGKWLESYYRKETTRNIVWSRSEGEVRVWWGRMVAVLR